MWNACLTSTQRNVLIDGYGAVRQSGSPNSVMWGLVTCQIVSIVWIPYGSSQDSHHIRDEVLRNNARVFSCSSLVRGWVKKGTHLIKLLGSLVGFLDF